MRAALDDAGSRPCDSCIGQPLELDVESPEVEALLVATGPHRSVAVDAETAITGLERSGIPYLEQGDELELVVSACYDERDPSDRRPLLLARTLSRSSTR